jgi:hypothetical protein
MFAGLHLSESTKLSNLPNKETIITPDDLISKINQEVSDALL